MISPFKLKNVDSIHFFTLQLTKLYIAKTQYLSKFKGEVSDSQVQRARSLGLRGCSL